MSLMVVIIRHLMLSACVLGWAMLPASAQVITGTPGAPDALEFPDSRFLPIPSPPFTGSIMPNAIDSKPAWKPTIAPPERS
jgi:arylsulfatase